MKIAIFLPSLRGGGAERVMLHLARGFVESGYDVDLVLAKCEGSYLSQLPKNVNVVDLKARRVLTSLPGLVRYLRQARPAALLSAMDHSNIIALWAKRLARVQMRVVVSVHVVFSIGVKNSYGRGRLLPYIVRWCYGWADGVVAVSQGVADDLSNAIDLPCERICVIYNPVVVPELFELANESVSHPWCHVDDVPIVLSVGRLTTQKDYPTLLKAFSLAKRERIVRLIILGEGEGRAELEEMVRDLNLEDVVDMPGFVKNPYAYMSKATVFVLSSAWEGFGNVLVEAMAVGTPVVATDCPSGPAEILENGKWGRLVPVGDANALAAAVITTLSEFSRPDVAARALVFNVDQAVKEYLQLLLPPPIGGSSVQSTTEVD